MASKTPVNRSVIVESSPSAIDKVYREVLAELEENNFNETDTFAVHLALKEAFLNAVKHGNKMDSSKEIKIDYSISTDKAEIYITDEGKGFDPNAVPDPRCEENLYKTDGRGLLLIRSYMDIVEFNEQGNCMHLVRHKRTQEPNQDK